MELSKSEFAARKGWSKPYVSKLGKQGRLVLTDDGKVDVAATEALLADSADPSKAGVAERHQRERTEKGVGVYIAPTAPPLDDPQAPPGGFNFQNSRAQREFYLAVLAENEARKSSGELVARQAVENAAFATGRQLRDLILGLPKQISPALAAITDPWELERELVAHLRRVLEDANRMSATDLEQALQPPN